MKAAPEERQTTGAGMSVGELGQYLSRYAQDLFRDKPPARGKFEVDEEGHVIIPEGEKNPIGYMESYRATAPEGSPAAPVGRSYGREGELQWRTGIGGRVGIEAERTPAERARAAAGLPNTGAGFARMSDPDQRVERGEEIRSRDPTDPTVREGFYEALRKRYPDRTPTQEETARAASEYLGGNERVTGASPRLIDELLNTDETGKRKPKKKQFTARQLDIASRKETLL